MLDISYFSTGEETGEKLYLNVDLIKRIYDITSKILNKSVNIPEFRKKNIGDKLKNLIQLLDDSCVYNYEEFSQYDCSGVQTRWNIIALIFLCVSNLNIILIRLFPVTELAPPLTQEQKKELLNECVIIDQSCLDYKLTQMPFYNTLCCLSNRWNDLSYSDTLEKFVYRLRVRAAEIIIEAETEEILDGGETFNDFKERGKTKKKKDKNANQFEVHCSEEFINDVAIMFTCFIRSFTVRRFFVSIDSKFEFVEHEFLYEKEDWITYDYNKLRKGFRTWLTQEANNMQRASLKGKLSETILRLNFRPGDIEKYTRHAGGVKASSALTVIEHCRTTLQSNWWNLKLLKGGFSPIIEKWYDVLPHKRIIDALILKIINQHLETTESFPWWNHCVLLEWDFFNFTDDVLLIDEPIIIQYMGEFNVCYDKTLYCTKQLDAAIILWVIIMDQCKNSVYKTTEETWKLTILKCLLDIWEE